MELHSVAKKLMLAVAGLFFLFLIVRFIDTSPHHHHTEGIEIQGNDDHIHVIYSSVYDLEPKSIQSITAYFPAQNRRLFFEEDRIEISSLQSSCRDIREWVTHSPEVIRQITLTNREATELRNLYSNINPDFRIDQVPANEDYGLPEPEGCIYIYTENDQIFLQFGTETAQGFSRYMRINRTEPVYIVSRYFFTTFIDFFDDF